MLLLALAAIAAQDEAPVEIAHVPWVVVDQPKPTRYDSLWNPCILVGANGSLTASVEHRGHYNGQLGTYVYRSTDRGETWKRVAHLDSPREVSLFEAGGKLHLIGVDGTGRGNSGHPILRTSTDGGVTWSTPTFGSPGWLLGEPFGQLDSGPAAAVTAAGRVWRPFVKELQALVVASAPIDSDLSEDANWTWSSELPLEKSWGWYTSVLLPRGKTSPPLLLARKKLGPPLLLTASLSGDGRTLERREKPAEIELPDLVAGYSLPRDEKGGGIVLLRRSEDLESERGWREVSLSLWKENSPREAGSILLRERRPPEQAVTFSWSGWTIDGDDLLIVFSGGTPQQGEEDPARSRRLLFLRVQKFRERTENSPPMWEGR